MGKEKTVVDALIECWEDNRINDKQRSYYLKGEYGQVMVVHEKDCSDIVFQRFVKGKHEPWFVNWADLCGRLSGFSGILTIKKPLHMTTKTYSFSFKLKSGQINFIAGDLRVRGIKDFEEYLKELAKIKDFFTF